MRSVRRMTKRPRDAVLFGDVLDVAAAPAGRRSHVYLAQTPLLVADSDEAAPLAPLLADLPDAPPLVVRAARVVRACLQ